MRKTDKEIEASQAGKEKDILDVKISTGGFITHTSIYSKSELINGESIMNLPHPGKLKSYTIHDLDRWNKDIFR